MSKTTPSAIKDESKSFDSAKDSLQQGLQLLESQKWIAAREHFYKALEHSQEYMQCYADHKHTLAMVQILVETGKKMNCLMDYRTAVTCFNSAMCLVIGCGSTQPERIMAMCNAFSGLIETFLFMKEIDSAVSVLNQYKGYLLDVELQNCDVKLSLGNVLLDVGLAQLNNTMIGSAKETLEEAKSHLLRTGGNENAHRVAKLLSSLGFCHLCKGSDHAADYLMDAIEWWKKLNYPLEECHTIINTMKHFLEALVRAKITECGGYSDKDACKDMMDLHGALHQQILGMAVPEAFTYLGMVAFNKTNEVKAMVYFEHSLALYRQLGDLEKNKDEICKLLRCIGIASYNCRNYQKAADNYQECLAMLESTESVNASVLSRIAECCAALGFSYSRLRNFDKMLTFYEKALEFQNRLAYEDLELIETNIGSLYQVKAVIFEQNGENHLAQKYFRCAEEAFTKALRYTWKSFPFINYGYYLLCRGEYSAAANTLQQAYLNGVIDHDTVEFDHTEDPILLDDLKTELEGREDIRVPAPIIALYLKCISQAKMGNIVGAKSTARQLQQEVLSSKYENFYVIGFGLERMKALCFSLLAYAYRTLGCNAQAYGAFKNAVAILPDYPAARKNLRCQSSSIVHKIGK